MDIDRRPDEILNGHLDIEAGNSENVLEEFKAIYE